jgi:predicted outer membrane repeat protein
VPSQVEFIGNDAGPGAGGAYYSQDRSSLEVVGPAMTSFIGNTAERAGGAVCFTANSLPQTMVVSGPLCAPGNTAVALLTSAMPTRAP